MADLRIRNVIRCVIATISKEAGELQAGAPHASGRLKGKGGSVKQPCMKTVNQDPDAHVLHGGFLSFEFEQLRSQNAAISANASAASQHRMIEYCSLRLIRCNPSSQ